MKFNGLSYGNRKHSVIPLYSRIESVIRSKIISEQFAQGELLPKEDDLARYYKVSKITIRSALARLEAEGLIVRISGKGTFVAENIPVRKQFIITGGIHNIVLDAERYEVNLLGIETVKVRDTRNPREIGPFLNLNNEDMISVVRRVRLLKGIPIYFLENFIPLDIAKHLAIPDLSQRPLLKILKDKIGLIVSRGEAYIEAIPTDADVAEILKIQIYDPLILIRTLYWLRSGQPFEMVNCFMKSDYFKYRVDLDAKGFENI